MTHDDNRRLIAGAALGDLDADEWRDSAHHLRACGDCRRLERDLEDVLVDLALLVPSRVPPATLLGAVSAAVRRSDGQDADLAHDAAPAGQPLPFRPAASTVSAAPTAADTVVPIRRAVPRRSFFAVVGLAAALAVVAVGLGATSARLGTDLERTRADVAQLQAGAATDGALMAAIADPAHRTASLHAETLAPDATAVVVYVPGTTQAWLVADHMPATPAGRTYQVWYADASGAHPLETASWGGRGVMVAPVAADLARSAAVMVTLEPTGGASGAPGPQVVFGELQAG